MVSEQVEQLRGRVASGIEWLIDHDDSGAFHHWFTAGLTSLSPMPAQTDERREAWKEYFKQRRRWEQMSSDLERIDPTWRTKT